MPRPVEENSEFAAALESLMRARGLSQAQLARELDEYDGNISRWRRGKPIDLLKVRKIADYFGVDRGWLERLAGYGDSEPALSKDIEVERGMWNAVYDDLIEKQVPRPMWESYINACLALAKGFAQMTRGGELNTADAPALNRSTDKNAGGANDALGEDLTSPLPWSQPRYPFMSAPALG